jgi:hypothetical protein
MDEPAENPAPRKRRPQPEMDRIIQWVEDEGGCESTDGCWVEPDGECEHGCQSWMLELGLI